MMNESTLLEVARKYALDIIDGLNESVTPFHAVEYCKGLLKQAGFTEIFEK